MIPYESKLDAIVIVPNELRDAINAKLDAALSVTPGAEPDREYLYSTLLAFFHEHGYLPEFELHKRSENTQ
jgi:hypothetical protein